MSYINYVCTTHIFPTHPDIKLLSQVLAETRLVRTSYFNLLDRDTSDDITL